MNQLNAGDFELGSMVCQVVDIQTGQLEMIKFNLYSYPTKNFLLKYLNTLYNQAV